MTTRKRKEPRQHSRLDAPARDTNARQRVWLACPSPLSAMKENNNHPRTGVLPRKERDPSTSGGFTHHDFAEELGRIRKICRTFGPGLITGASDDDPSGIATYSQVGAQFRYALLWTMVVSYPLMAAIQEISARVGRVTGCGISGNLRRFYPRWSLRVVIALVLIANIFNLGADIGAMGAAAQLILPSRTWIYTLVFGLGSLLLQILVPYTRYVKYLKWLTLSLFAYVAAAFFVHISWAEVLRSTMLPRINWSRPYFMGLIAVLGTTISPYLFFWQASQEVEEVKTNRGEKPLIRAPGQAKIHLERIRTDTYVGMALSNVVGFFIILTAAASLHAQGITDVATAAQAAQALESLGGKLATGLFACGIIGTGLLAIPVLAGSAAYVLGEAYKWPASLEKKPIQAPGFYLTIALATVAGIVLNFLHINPMRALFWAAVLNGVLAGPLMGVIMHMASSKKVMGSFVLSRQLRVIGWTAAAVMCVVACLGVLLTSS
jgi:NRAMP (natural resistance-associated macrophage protein)-like metal ion transporter